MSLDAILRDVVGVAHELTLELQVDVVHEAFVERAKNSVPQYGPPVTRPALLQQLTKQVATVGGSIIATGPVTFLANVEISVEDRLTLPDGKVGTVVYVGGLRDRTVANGSGFITEVWLGEGGGSGVTR